MDVLAQLPAEMAELLGFCHALVGVTPPLVSPNFTFSIS